MVVVTHEMGFARGGQPDCLYGPRRHQRGEYSGGLFDHPKDPRLRGLFSKGLVRYTKEKAAVQPVPPSIFGQRRFGRRFRSNAYGSKSQRFWRLILKKPSKKSSGYTAKSAYQPGRGTLHIARTTGRRAVVVQLWAHMTFEKGSMASAAKTDQVLVDFIATTS